MFFGTPCSWTEYAVLWKTSFGLIWDILNFLKICVNPEFERKRIHPQSRSFERRICAQTQDLQIFKKHCILSSTTLHSRSLPLNEYFDGLLDD